jgi:hypothetical protein
MKSLLVLITLLIMPLCSATAAEKECIISGCSGELCVSESNNMASICIYRAEFSCYKKHGTCEQQAGGECGWTQTPALKDCIAQAQTHSDSGSPMKPVAQ